MGAQDPDIAPPRLEVAAFLADAVAPLAVVMAVVIGRFVGTLDGGRRVIIRSRRFRDVADVFGDQGVGQDSRIAGLGVVRVPAFVVSIVDREGRAESPEISFGRAFLGLPDQVREFGDSDGREDADDGDHDH